VFVRSASDYHLLRLWLQQLQLHVQSRCSRLLGLNQQHRNHKHWDPYICWKRTDKCTYFMLYIHYTRALRTFRSHVTIFRGSLNTVLLHCTSLVHIIWLLYVGNGLHCSLCVQYGLQQCKPLPTYSNQIIWTSEVQWSKSVFSEPLKMVTCDRNVRRAIV
jgi:hypothetical protein